MIIGERASGNQLLSYTCRPSIVGYRLSVTTLGLNLKGRFVFIVIHRWSLHFRPLFIGYRLTDMRNWVSVIRYRVSAIGYQLYRISFSFIGIRVLAIICWLWAIGKSAEEEEEEEEQIEEKKRFVAPNRYRFATVYA